jgi:hypothetical protein
MATIAMATVATCPHSQSNLHNQHLWDLFFKVLKKKIFTWEVKQKVVLEVNFFLLKKKDPWVLWKVALAIGAEMTAAMAIFVNAFNRDNF